MFKREVNLWKLVKWRYPAKFTSASSSYHQLKPWHCMALSLTLPSDRHYLPTYHLTLSQTDQHLVLVSAREVDKNGRVSLNPSPFTAAAACYVKPFGTRLGWPLSNWGLNSTFTHSFISRAGYMSGTGQTRHGEGPIFLSTHLSDDNGGFHSRVKNYITQSRFSLFSLKLCYLYRYNWGS